ncbi:unnamed protein product [Adineta ricciae]|uniref:Major facilitator superfamily (MFS) profile domain-containing protein n=1 Tax=Adineta ricciae TaxID=249248 RepID=A0A814QPU4_ADIRI|nr:unnamed protein product [Adineta ricciae]CAF1188590.1 unnamed protein product [Adineta ricciae]
MAEPEAANYRVYRARWFQLFIFVLATFSNAIHNMTFAPIQSQTSTFYGLSTLQVNVLAIVFQFLYVVGTILSFWLYRVLSVRTVILIGSLLNLGTFIRLFSLISPSNGYPALIIGQIFPAIATPLFINITPLFAARWFPPKQRDIATAISSMSNPLGLAVGSLLPSLIVSDGYSSIDFFTLLIVEAGFSALVALIVIFLFRSEPPTPPSSSVEHHIKVNLRTDFINLLKNRHYLVLLFSFSLGLALFSALVALLFQLIQPVGYTSDDAGIFGAVIILAGLTSAFLVGIIMDRTHAYRFILKSLLIGVCASSIYFVLILQPNQYYPLAVSIGLMGFFLLPLLPVAFECAVECTYPISAEWSTGILMCLGNLFGGVFIFVLDALLKLDPLSTSPLIFTPASVFILCCCIISAVVLMTYQGPYLRLEGERRLAPTINT